MNRSFFAGAWLALVLSASLAPFQTAQAHFVWVLAPAGESSPIQVYFSEEAAPDSAKLVTKIGQTTAWLRTPGSPDAPVTLSPKTEGDLGWLTGGVNVSSPAAVEAHCKYGVISREGKPFLLQYYAKHLRADNVDQLGQLLRSQKLPLDLVPTVADGRCEVAALWQGKPAADAEVIAHTGDGKTVELKTDANGKVTLDATKPGVYALRVRVVEADKAGKEGDNEYFSTRHYSTLTLQLPLGSKTVTATAKASDVPNTASGHPAVAKAEGAKAEGDKPAAKPMPDPAAAKLLADAREARAVWENFPGFTAKLVVFVEGKSATGKVTVSAQGGVKVEDLGDLATPDMTRQLNSLVMHRMPGSAGGDEASFVTESGEHALGTLVRLHEDRMGSLYRVRDLVITEVNRDMGKSKFSIRVLEVEKNAEGKYLPRVFTVNFWNRETGSLDMNETLTHQWKRVGGFDLPQTVIAVTARPNSQSIVKLEFKDLQLLPASK